MEQSGCLILAIAPAPVWFLHGDMIKLVTGTVLRKGFKGHVSISETGRRDQIKDAHAERSAAVTCCRGKSLGPIH